MGSSMGNKDGLSSAFPSFYTEADNTSEGATRPPLGFLAFGGIMFGDTQKRFGMYAGFVYAHMHGCMCGWIMLGAPYPLFKNIPVWIVGLVTQQD